MKYHFEFDIDLLHNPYPGLYIALEGIDGSGKTSQIDYLKKYFESQGREVVTTREPRKDVGLVAEINNKALQGTMKIPRSAYQYLFTADRIMHLEELVVPALTQGKVVITDRCFWSAIPYGAIDVDHQFDQKKAQSLLVAQGVLAYHYQVIVPNITFYFDLPVEESLRRSGQVDKTKEIYEEKETLEQVVKGYKWLLKEFPNEFTVLDAKQSVEEVTKNMVQIVEQKYESTNKKS